MAKVLALTQYDQTMRRIFILLMIALLPLRGWAGELMTMQMATSALTSQAAMAMPSDCPMHAQSSAAADEDAAQSDAMQACGSCDLCLPIAEIAAVQVHVGSSAAHVQRASYGSAFVSAAPAPGFKPPIS